MRSKSILVMVFLALNLSALIIGEVPKLVTIKDDNGGLVKDGGTWNSSAIKDKVIVLFYVDPDEKDTNAHFTAKLKEKAYKRDKYGTIAILNLAATWTPNVLLENILKTKQKEFPHTIYVKDKNSVLVQEWNIEDDASNVIIFSKTGKVLFYKSGKMSASDMEKAFKVIDENIVE